MSTTIYILGLSVLLQFAAAGLGLRLIRITGRRATWILMASALTLMGLRRSITLYGLLFGEVAPPADISSELFFLAESVLVVVGMALIGPAFLSITRSEAALGESQRALSTLMSNLPGLAYRCANDTDWTMEFVSEGCLELTGYQPADLTGGKPNYAQLIHPEDRSGVWNDVQEAVGEHRPFRLVYRIISASGEEKWVWEQGRGVFSPTGELLALEGFVTDISERKSADRTLRHRIEFENLITGISTKFINLASEEIDEGINQALRTLGEFAGVDRSYVFRYVEDATSMDNTHEWCAEGIKPAIHDLQQFPVASVPWFTEQIKRLETIHVPRVADLPEEAHLEKKEWQRESIQSLVCVPMVCGGSLIGFLGFDSVRAQKSWDEELIALLRIVGEVFAGTLERNRAEEDLRTAHDDLERRVKERTAELSATNESLQREITERKQAEEALRESQQRLQGILDNTTALIYVKDQHGRYLLINRRFEELFEVTRDRLIGKTGHEIFPKEIAATFRANDRRVLQGGVPMEFEEIAPGKDGFHTYISLKFPLLDHDERPYAVCGISTDITERKRAAVELKMAKEAAEAASQAKSRFLANMSHEIRTPLTALLGAAELLPLDDGSGNDPKSKDHLGTTVFPPRLDTVDVILRNGRHLLSLIDDLLDLSQIEAGKLEVRCTLCSLLDVMADVEAVTAPLHLNSRVEFRLIYESEIPARIHTDPKRLKQIVINLVNNALKFTQVGHVKVRVGVPPGHQPGRSNEEADGHEESELVVMVEDTGPGIPSDQLEHVFDTFTRLDAVSTGGSPGVGLGLPLSRWFAGQLGGSLTVTSVVGRGSTFVLRVPTGRLDDVDWIPPEQTSISHRCEGEDRQIPSASPGGTSSDQPVSGRARPARLCGRILLAEDFRDARDLIAYALRAAGAEVTTVDNGRDAVREAMEKTFDLILMDIRMPTMDGTEAARKLRSTGSLAPIIALTASTSQRDRERFLAAGFDDLWTKPLSLEQLVNQAAAYITTTPLGDRPGCRDLPAGTAPGPSRSGGAQLTRPESESREIPPDVPGSHPPPSEDPRMAAIVAEFVRSLPARFRQIEAALASQDLDRTGELLHQLAGTGGIHGYMSLSEEAARLLQATKDGTLSGQPGRLTAIENVIREITGSLPEDDTESPAEKRV